MDTEDEDRKKEEELDEKVRNEEAMILKPQLVEEQRIVEKILGVRFGKRSEKTKLQIADGKTEEQMEEDDETDGKIIEEKREHNKIQEADSHKGDENNLKKQFCIYY